MFWSDAIPRNIQFRTVTLVLEVEGSQLCHLLVVLQMVVSVVGGEVH